MTFGRARATEIPTIIGSAAMWWLYDTSPRWRRLVHRTAESRGAMATFIGATTFASVAAGWWAMGLTKPRGERAEGVSQHAEGDAAKVAGENKRRLGEMLDEVRRGDTQASEERYRLALKGRTKGGSPGTSQQPPRPPPSSSSSSSSSPPH